MVMAVTNFNPKTVSNNNLQNARQSGDGAVFLSTWTSGPVSGLPPAPNTMTPVTSLIFEQSTLFVQLNQLGFVDHTESVPNYPNGQHASDRVIFTCDLYEVTGPTTYTKISTQTRTFNYPQSGTLSTSFRFEFSGLTPQKNYMVGLQAWSRTDRTPYQESRLAVQTPQWGSFWSQRDPQAPTITSPPTNTAVPYNATSPTEGVFTMKWTQNDPDMDSSQPTNPERSLTDYSGWEVQYRAAPTPGNPNPEWQQGTRRVRGESGVTNTEYWLRQNTVRGGGSTTSTQTAIPGPGVWQLRVRYKDDRFYNRTPPTLYGGAWSPWSLPVTVIYTAAYLPPLTISPVNDTAVSTEQVDFVWQFRDPRTTGGSQNRREVQIREVGTSTWFQVIPSGAQASAVQSYSWTPAGSGFELEPGKRYEWQARTRSTPGNHVSTWSESAFFWAVPDPGSGAEIPLPDETVPDSGLGVGNNRVFVFDRGGSALRGELKHKTLVRWHRKRDDLSSLTVRIEGWDAEDVQLLKKIRSWMNELVVYREVDGQKTKRVWEGPVTRITYGPDYVEFEAHDVLAYVYRRILRQGWNDSYRAGGGGLTPITVRAASIIQNALAYDDPNVLAYLQARVAPDDTRQSRVVADFSSSAFEALDSLAATAGLDYTAAGRRIIVWDTHNQLGVLPEMRDGDFDNPILITEYGMRLATAYAISNNQGVYGLADRSKAEYGYIEMVDSAYGETDAGGVEETLTEEARLELVQTLTGQAERSIASRYPAPLLARVPDNSRIMPDVQVGINQLIPGVFIPLRADHPIRPISQKQKLDSVTVEQIGSDETVRIVLSPAPRDRDDDPDSGLEDA